MTNLDLGSVIWLDVSRRLLSFYEWFFTPWERRPQKVRDEFRRHKHTHPPVRILAAPTVHTHKISVEKSHRSHDHSDATVTSSSEDHDHSISISAVDCGSGYTHGHSLAIYTWDAHTHSVTVAFAAADLGSPVWSNHVHAVSLVSCGAGGSSHTHPFVAYTGIGLCVYCWALGTHKHGCGTTPTGSGGSSHTHTLTGFDSGTATGTCEAHTHSFSSSLDAGDNHRHSAGGNVVNAECTGGYDHTHARDANTSYETHTHTISGDSGSGGEPCPEVAQPFGDGLVFVS